MINLGQLALWDLTSWFSNRKIFDRNEKEELAEVDEIIPSLPHWNDLSKPETFCRFSYHRETISQILFPREDQGRLLLTSAYDGTIRGMDLQSSQVCTLHRDPERHALITSMDTCPGTHLLWYSTSAGNINALDFRTQLAVFQSPTYDATSRVDYPLCYSGTELFDKKCGCVSVHPQESNLILASSNDTSMRIYDIRGGSPGPSDSNEQFSLLSSYNHGYSCSSAYWRPEDGQSIVSTSYDDQVRIWSDLPETLQDLPTPKSIPHDNRTGKWVSIFRCVLFLLVNRVALD
jgi:WD40 repeat protein